MRSYIPLSLLSLLLCCSCATTSNNSQTIKAENKIIATKYTTYKHETFVSESTVPMPDEVR
jgi:hypothetical protein